MTLQEQNSVLAEGVHPKLVEVVQVVNEKVEFEQVFLEMDKVLDLTVFLFKTVCLLILV